jgi:predicted transposase/invertase (TIGR01784 family)
MRRDSIFYRLFQTNPSLLFELLPEVPIAATNYRFDSVEIKEMSFRIDGVFIPTDDSVVYFVEVQFQKDRELYERLFAELFLYLRQKRTRCTDWRAIVIYPSRSIEQEERTPYQMLLDSSNVIRVYLNELGEIESLSPGLGLMVLTTLSERVAPEKARWMIDRANTQPNSRAIIEMVTEIMVYKFANLSRSEVDEMLGIKLEETRVYREARAEGEQRGEQKGEQNIITILITEKFGNIPPELKGEVAALSGDKLPELARALLRFETIEDLTEWLKNRSR